ncbi:pilus assembly protein [Delftia acidovorans]|jgi:hypothetical protein|uniref:TfpX/TfpZ family type IV pilin accessory protein n=1 Tax=Delftia acidovorans TaxID=80866 RepID=UPI001EFD4509|nr:TfpX/TfpZ family type IV pilin accessory protein [Delftia acidovorans]MCG8989099.1 pilus assembly protein [Delftia acidovorans]
MDENYIKNARLKKISWRDKIKASLVHLLVSIAIAGILATFLLTLWYPYPYREISGGRELLTIITIVDVVLGPLITLIVFNRNKSFKELFSDFCVIATIQISALSFGVWTAYSARPVYLAFEYHRLAVVHAADIDPEMIKQAPEEFRRLPLTGPALISLRPLQGADALDSTMLALNGIPQSAQPNLWQEYSQEKPQILREAKSIEQLKDKFPGKIELINKKIQQTGLSSEKILYLPLISRKNAWTALLDSSTATPVGFINIDSF